MRMRPLLLVPFLAAGCIPMSPGVAVTKREPAFDIAQLTRARVAVWPVAAAKVDPAAAEGVTGQYGSEEAFLDSLGKTVSSRLVRAGGPPSLGSDQVIAALAGVDATRPLLDSRRLLGAETGSRFSAPPPELATLGSLPSLEGIQYAVLLPLVSLSLEQKVSGTGSPQGSTHVGTISWARGHLRVAVVDLGRGAVVWEGDLSASGSLAGYGFKQIEEGLGTALDDSLGLPRARPALSRCKTSADCGRGVCLSGYCR